jgi:hypothetical protein
VLGVVDDGDKQLAGAVDNEGLLQEEPFAVVDAALELELEGVMEQAAKAGADIDDKSNKDQ